MQKQSAENFASIIKSILKLLIKNAPEITEMIETIVSKKLKNDMKLNKQARKLTETRMSKSTERNNSKSTRNEL